MKAKGMPTNHHVRTTLATLLAAIGVSLLASACGGGGREPFVNTTFTIKCADNPPLGAEVCAIPPATHVAIGENGDVDPNDNRLTLTCEDEELASGTILLTFHIAPGDGSSFAARNLYIDPNTGALLDDAQIDFEDGVGNAYRGVGGPSLPSDAQPCQLTTFLVNGHDYATTVLCESIRSRVLTARVRDVESPTGGAFAVELSDCK